MWRMVDQNLLWDSVVTSVGIFQLVTPSRHKLQAQYPEGRGDPGGKMRQPGWAGQETGCTIAALDKPESTQQAPGDSE